MESAGDSCAAAMNTTIKHTINIRGVLRGCYGGKGGRTVRALGGGWIWGSNSGAEASQDWSSSGPPCGPQHQSVLVHSGWGPGGRIDAAGRPRGTTIDENLPSFDLEHDFLDLM